MISTVAFEARRLADWALFAALTRRRRSSYWVGKNRRPGPSGDEPSWGLWSLAVKANPAGGKRPAVYRAGFM